MHTETTLVLTLVPSATDPDVMILTLTYHMANLPQISAMVDRMNVVPSGEAAPRLTLCAS